MPLIPELKRQACLVYRVVARQPQLYRETLSQKGKKTKQNKTIHVFQCSQFEVLLSKSGLLNQELNCQKERLMFGWSNINIFWPTLSAVWNSGAYSQEVVSKSFSAFVVKQNCLNKQKYCTNTRKVSNGSLSLKFQHPYSRQPLFSSLFTND